MFKFLIRRIRYGLAGRTIIFLKMLAGTIVLSILIIFTLSGSFSQKDFVKKTFDLFWTSSVDTSKKIESTLNGEKDAPIVVTDEGVYLKGKEIGDKIDLKNESTSKSESEEDETEGETSEKTEEETKESE